MLAFGRNSANGLRTGFLLGLGGRVRFRHRFCGNRRTPIGAHVAGTVLFVTALMIGIIPLLSRRGGRLARRLLGMLTQPNQPVGRFLSSRRVHGGGATALDPVDVVYVKPRATQRARS
jgi:hypothetical protein